MLKKLTQTVKDMGTIKTLCEAAERIANEEQHKEPGAEHFVLAALELGDGSAQRVFDRLGLTATQFRDALRESHRADLRAVGVSAAEIARSEQGVPPLPRADGLYNAAASGAAVLKDMAALRKRGVAGPLVGVHVLDVALAMQDGPTLRAFDLLGRNGASVVAAVRQEMALAA